MAKNAPGVTPTIGEIVQQPAAQKAGQGEFLLHLAGNCRGRQPVSRTYRFGRGFGRGGRGKLSITSSCCLAVVLRVTGGGSMAAIGGHDE